MFIHSDLKAPGLTPTITIKRSIDDQVIISAVLMTDIGNGLYKYDFSNIDDSLQYYYVCTDGTEVAVGSIESKQIVILSGLTDTQNSKLMGLKNTDALIMGQIISTIKRLRRE